MTIYREPVRADFWQLAKEPGSSQYIDPLGPKNCMTHTAARAVMRTHEGRKPAGITGSWPPTGYAIRRYTGDTVGGVNHGQVKTVLAAKYATSLTLYYGLDFDVLPDLIEETRGVMLSLWYEPILNSSKRGSFTFRENHEIWINEVDRDRRLFQYVVDPLADGRYAGIYKGPGSYPFSLLREAAGELNIAASGYRALGFGRAYVAVTKPTGGYVVPVPPTSTVIPRLVMSAPTPSERNVMISQTALTVNSSHKKTLVKGQPLFRHPGGPKVTAMSVAGPVHYMGGAGTDWQAVRVNTGAPYVDNKIRPTILYVPLKAGPVERW